MAIKPTISLRGLRSSASQTEKSTKTIKSSLASNIKQKKNLYSSIKIIKKRREERDKRNLLQTQLVAPTLVRARGGAKSLATTTQQGLGIGDRLMGFLKYASAGWLLSNIPTWSALGNQLVGRLKTAGNILSNYSDETLKVLTGITNVFSAALTNISSFDFLDSSSRLKNSFEDLMTNVDDLGKGIMDAFNVILQPFTDIPPLGSDQLERERQQQEQDSGTRQPQPPPRTRGGNAAFWTLVAVVSREDGDPQGRADVAQSIYNRVSSGAYGKNIKEVILSPGQYQPTWDYPRKRGDRKPNPEWYQITDAESAAKATGFSPEAIKNVANSITNPSLQKEAAKFVGGRTDFKGANTGGPPSIQRKGGDNWFGWEYNYRGTQVGKIPDFGLSQAPAPAQPQRNLPPNAPQFNPNKRYRKGDVITGSIGRGVDYVEIGDTLGAGRNHQGIDIFCPYGTYIALRLDCEVVFAGWQNPNNHREGYGRVIDVWIPNLGVQLRFGHCAGFLVTSGKVKAGKSFARVGETGNARGAHIHLEYSKTRNSSSGNSGDPSPYIPYILLTTQAGNPTAQVASQSRPSVPLVPTPAATTTQEEQQAQIDSSYREGLAEGITQERQGRKVVVIDDRSSPIIQQVMAGSGGDGISFSINESALLNNFIKNKLLLDLNYV